METSPGFMKNQASMSTNIVKTEIKINTQVS